MFYLLIFFFKIIGAATAALIWVEIRLGWIFGLTHPAEPNLYRDYCRPFADALGVCHGRLWE